MGSGQVNCTRIPKSVSYGIAPGTECMVTCAASQTKFLNPKKSRPDSQRPAAIVFPTHFAHYSRHCRYCTFDACRFGCFKRWAGPALNLLLLLFYLRLRDVWANRCARPAIRLPGLSGYSPAWIKTPRSMHVRPVPESSQARPDVGPDVP